MRLMRKSVACPVLCWQKQTWKLGLSNEALLNAIKNLRQFLNSCVAFPASVSSSPSAVSVSVSVYQQSVCLPLAFFIVPIVLSFLLLLFYGKFSKPTRKFATQSARGSGNTKPYDLIRILCSCYRCCF